MLSYPISVLTLFLFVRHRTILIYCPRMQALEAERAAPQASKAAAQRERRRVSAAEARLVCLLFALFVDPFCSSFSRPILYTTEFRVLVILFTISWSSPDRLLLSLAVARIIFLLRSRRNAQSAYKFSC